MTMNEFIEKEIDPAFDKAFIIFLKKHEKIRKVYEEIWREKHREMQRNYHKKYSDDNLFTFLIN